MATRSKLLQSAFYLAVAHSFASATLQDFGSVAVGGSKSATLTYSLTGLSAVPNFSLSWSRDFQLGAPACTVAATTNCSIAIAFSPVRPGVRQDALTITNQSGSVLLSTPLRGVGQSALIALYPGIISTLSGNGTWGYEDSSNPAMAMFRNPQGIALDGSGAVAYVADSVNQRIRKVTLASGAVSTVAGTGSAGFAGDGGPATSASLNTPTGVAVDGAGNLYIADQGNNLIRRVEAATHIIHTVAGGGTVASGSDKLGDGGPATSAILYGPQSVALDPAGNLYIADAFHNLVRMVNAASGTITVVAGGGTSAGTDGFGDGGAATSAMLNNPCGLALDSAGNLYIADTDYNLVRRVDLTTGIITAVAGNGNSGYTGDNGLASSATLSSPQGVVLDAANNIYVADFGNNAIRQISASTQKILTLAGRGSTGYYGDGGNPAVAFLTNPTSLAVAENGNLYIADYGNNVIREVSYAAVPMTFPGEPLGAISPTQVVAPINIGNETLRLSGISLSANFQQVSSGLADCAANLPLTPGSSCDVGVSFVPVQTGAIAGSLALTSNSLNSSSNVQTVNLTAKGLPGAGPKVSLSVPALTFPGQLIGVQSLPQTLTLTNSGGSAFTISSIWLAGSQASDFEISSNCGASLAAGAQCGVSVTFAPTSTGTRTATLMFSDSVEGTPQIVTLTGTGNGGVVVLGATALSFNGMPGQTSTPQSVSLTNTGSYPLHILSVWITGTNASEFNVSTSCGATVAAGATCKLTVSFTPLALGSRTAKLNLTDDASGPLQTVSLSGNAVKGGTRYRPIFYGSELSQFAGESTQQFRMAGSAPDTVNKLREPAVTSRQSPATPLKSTAPSNKPTKVARSVRGLYRNKRRRSRKPRKESPYP
jgi:sugar lactone lactonase YvrE